jgi:ATPase subunit of ABC transporter with duplicated ATPase domains
MKLKQRKYQRFGFVCEDFTSNSEFSEDGECELSWLKFFAKPDLILLDEPTSHGH